MAVDEIHLFDDQGTIYSGSAPKYFGYNFDSGTQMEYFKPMLKDKSLTMCQDVTPNTAAVSYTHLEGTGKGNRAGVSGDCRCNSDRVTESVWRFHRQRDSFSTC